MIGPDRGAADRLNAYLDTVVTGDAMAADDLDLTMEATVKRFFGADDAPAPPPDPHSKPALAGRV